MRTDMCVGTCIDLLKQHVHGHVRKDMRREMCIGMRADLSTDICTDMSVEVWQKCMSVEVCPKHRHIHAYMGNESELAEGQAVE